VLPARKRRVERQRENNTVSKEIFVNSDARETRIAVREDGKLVELHIEREERIVGSLYKGRVDNVVVGIDAAFIDIGLERNAFLYAGDIIGDDESTDGGNSGGGGNGFDRRGRRVRSHTLIKDLVKRGNEVLVQVTKGTHGTKGSRVSTRISLPGRYLVFMPDENSTGVSRKIDEPRERDRLKRIVESVRKPGYGLIVRTEAEGKTERELRQDLEYLERTWAEIKAKASSTRAPNLVYTDLTLLFRILRDAFGSDVDKLVLDSTTDFKKAHELLDFFGPTLKDRVVLHDADKPIFEHFGIEAEIEKNLGRKVWLKSGGYLIIDQAEALTAIDVNSGRSSQGGAHSETILQTNLEAVAEIARQLRLRDMGGILVLDLIDMDGAADRKKVEQALETALKHDKNRCKVSHISPLGLIEMTRKRTGETITEQMHDSCTYCDGTGRLPSAESIALDIRRELRQLGRSTPAEALFIQCHPLVAASLVGESGMELELLEHEIQKGIYVRAADLHQVKYEIQPGKLDEFDRKLMGYKRHQIVEARVIVLPDPAIPAGIAMTDTGTLIAVTGNIRQLSQGVRVKLSQVGRSGGVGEALGKGSGGASHESRPAHHEGNNHRRQSQKPAESAPNSSATATATSSEEQKGNRRRRRRGGGSGSAG
jgi:ribonuclease G